MRPHRRQPTRLPCPWDSPGKNTGVGCHFLLQCMKVKSESEVAQSCLTLNDPMDCSLTGSSVHGIFQARVLEWVCLLVIDYRLFMMLCVMCTSPLVFHLCFVDYCILSTDICVCLFAQLCPPLCDPMDRSPSGSSVHGILQARSELPWPPPGDLPNPGIKSTSPALQADSLPTEPPGKPQICTHSSFSLNLQCSNAYFNWGNEIL